MRIRKVTAVAASSLLLLFAAFAIPQDPDKDDARVEAKIRQLMEQTGAADLGSQALNQMLDAFRQMPGLPDGFLDKFKELAKPEELVEMVVPIYKKHLDEKTIDAVIAFASTPEGKKFYAAQPALLRESMAAGQKWGEQLAQKVLRELGR